MSTTPRSRPSSRSALSAHRTLEAPPAFRDSDGRTLVLRGINMGNKWPPYVPDVTDDDFARIASWGLDTIRFLILWAAIEPEEGYYDDGYFDTVLPFLDMAQAHGLHVILDMHQDVYGEMFNQDGAPYWACPPELTEGFENQEEWWMDYFTRQVMSCFSWFWEDTDIQDHLIEAWRRAAEHLGNHPAVIGFDLYNEPYPGFNWTPRFEPEQLQVFYERLIPVLQAEAPDAYAFFEPWVLRDYFVPSFLEPMPFERLAYIPHYYNIPMELESTYGGHAATVRHWVASVQEEAAALGVPFLVGEYGGDTNGDGISALLTDVNDALDAANTGGMLWAYGKGDGGYAILNGDGSEKSWIVDAISRPYPRAVAGTLNDYKYDSEIRQLEVHYVRDASITAPTEIAAPSRLYPQGFQVYLSDTATMTATWDQARGILTIDDTGPDGIERTVALFAE